MKKILFYTSGIGLGGVEKVILEVLKKIDKTRFDIKLALQYENENFFEDEIPKEIKYKYMLPQNIINKSLYYRSRKKSIFYKILYSFMLKYEKYIIKKNYLKFSSDREIVIDFKSGDFLKLILLNNNKKVCWIHGEITKLNRYQERKIKLRKQLKKCNKVICICNEMRNNFLKEMPELEKNVNVIYNPFNVEEIRKKSQDYKNLSVEEKEMLKNKYIIMVSRLELKMKDFFTLFKAYKIVLKTNPDLKLYILGDGKDKEKILFEIKKMQLGDKIFLLGSKKNPYPWIKNAEMLVHSSKAEGLPTVLIEGLILNKIVVATNCLTGPKEILNNGEYGSLVEIGDFYKMAEEIIELLNPLSSRRNRYLKNLNEKILRFDNEIIINQIEQMLEKL